MSTVISAGTTTNTAYNVNADTSGTMALATGSSPTTAVYIDGSQNVGIGTSSPAYKLDILSSADGRVMFNELSTGGKPRFATNLNGTTNVVTLETYGASTDPALAFSTAATERMRIDSSGNVGIGTSSPNYQFQSYKGGAVANYLQVTSGATGTGSANGTLFGVDASGNGIVNVQGSVNYITSVAGLERMRIDTSGNFQIGSTGGTTRLNVYGTVGSATSQFQVGANGNTGILFTNASGGTAGYITVNASTVAYNTSSDYRLKTNVQPMTGALATVAQLKPVTYTWKADNSAGQGFIAHELQAVIPDCVTGTKDAVDSEGNPVYQGVDTSFLVATLTAAIQELNATITAQATTITTMQAQIAALQAKIGA